MQVLSLRLMRRFLTPLLAGLSLISAGCAGPTPSDGAEGVHSNPKAVGIVFVSGVYRGQIGGDDVEMTLTLDADSTDTVHGWYVLEKDPAHAHVLLAGELEDEALSMEESRNGVDVSGHFNAALEGSGFRGEWSDINGEGIKPVAFKRISQARGAS